MTVMPTFLYNDMLLTRLRTRSMRVVLLRLSRIQSIHFGVDLLIR